MGLKHSKPGRRMILAMLIIEIFSVVLMLVTVMLIAFHSYNISKVRKSLEKLQTDSDKRKQIETIDALRAQLQDTATVIPKSTWFPREKPRVLMKTDEDIAETEKPFGDRLV